MLFILFCAVCASVPVCAQQWTPPTPEELSMTSQPQAPGAAAVYLYSEQKSDDLLHQQSFYYRVKVLTEAGKARATVRLTSTASTAYESFTIPEFGNTITDVEGRTIHSDGTVIPFTGKPYERTVVESDNRTVTEMVFTLPDVEVGSILEYRYNVIKISTSVYSAPTWYVQQDLYVRKGEFSWKSLDLDNLRNVATGQMSQGVTYSATLPNGMSVTTTGVPAGAGAMAYHRFELTVHDVQPVPQENYVPPLRSSIYRVNFYFAYSASQTEYWKDTGKMWQRDAEHFIGSPDSLAGAVQTLVAPGDSDTVKLQKIYAAVMAMENTSSARKHEKSEEKEQDAAEEKSAKDVWTNKRGSDDDLTQLFIALARAAGMKAYDMKVTNRDTNIFTPVLLTKSQLNDDVAIVVVDGKEQFFDPGQKYCPFGQMAWKHSGTGGVREMEDGSTAIDFTTPEPPYTQSTTQRIADLSLNADGTASGTVQITWTGAPALQWRQQSLIRDEDDFKHALYKSIADTIPTGMKAEITTIDNLEIYEKPLVANFAVHGSLGAVMSQQLTLPGQFFEANSKPLFPEATRQLPIYFHYAGRTADIMRVKFPAEIQVQSVPKDDSFALLKLATYHSTPVVQPGVVLMRRSYVLGTAFFTVPEYADVKSFYDKMSADDQQPILLSIGGATAPATGAKAAP